MGKVISVENLSKAYQLGTFGTGTISHDLERYWARLRGKEDPFLKIGETNDRTIKGESNVVWSLKDINFDVEQGDAVGIIGRNGAGKSTLLKILSRITSPTTGNVRVKGRIASLLEVGTGFHPELTGKENIYLNGAVLGMRKSEIKRKFDEIVDFSGVDRYIDTPVKRYSSGMYVRLAFAVAAHLESEILIVDEVLSVGDAEFQKKCLGKMGDVSTKEGRTVLFVSHNTIALSNVCNAGILLVNGEIVFRDDINATIKNYLQHNNSSNNHNYYWHDKEGLVNNTIIFKYIELRKVELDEYGFDVITLNNAVKTTINYEVLSNNVALSIGIELFNSEQVCVFKLSSASFNNSGNYEAVFTIPGNFLNEDIYNLNIYLIKDKSIILKSFKRVTQFEISEIKRDQNWTSKWIGIVRPQIPIILNSL